MFITPLDFTNVRTELAKINSIRQKTQISNLLRIYSARYSRGEVVKDLQRSANILQMIMDKNIASNKPLHSNIENYYSTKITVRILEDKNVNESLIWLGQSIIRNELTDYVSINGDKTLNVVTDESEVTTLSTYDIIRLGKKYRDMAGLRQFEWVNICGNNIFMGDLLPEEALMLKTLNTYFCGIPNTKCLYGNFSLSSFVGSLGMTKHTVEVEYNYIKLFATYNLKPEESSLPLSLARRLDKIDLVLITAPNVYAKLMSGINMSECYYDIVYVDVKMSSKDNWKPKFCICNSFFEGTYTNLKYVPWPDENLQSIKYRILNTILRVDHVWVAAGKGIGKSKLRKAVRPDYLIIDSDVKGKFLYMLRESPEMLELLRTDPLNSRILSLFNVCVTDVNDLIPSLYELAASEFVTSRDITLDVILSPSASKHYHDFIQIYNNVSKPLSSDKNLFFKLSGTMLSFHNLLTRGIANAIKYTKVIQFTHNANELYGAMSDAIYTLEPTVNTIPIHLRRERKSTPIVQSFLSEFYIYTDTFTATPCTINLLHEVLVEILDSGK